METYLNVCRVPFSVQIVFSTIVHVCATSYLIQLLVRNNLNDSPLQCFTRILIISEKELFLRHVKIVNYVFEFLKLSLCTEDSDKYK